MICHLCRLVDDLGGVQQRLGGNAAHIEADPAEGLTAIHQDNRLPQVRGTECGGVAARPGAQYEDLGVQVALASRLWQCGCGGGSLGRGRHCHRSIVSGGQVEQWAPD